MTAVAADATIFEPNRPLLNQVEIPLARLPQTLDGFTIAQLSDFHYDDIFSVHPIRKAVEVVNQLGPDLVVLTGDFVTISALADYLHNEKDSLSAAEPCARLLSPLRARYGVFAVLGNHDVKAGPRQVTYIFKDQGLPMLRNQSVPIERDGARLWLAGLDSVSEGKPDPERALQNILPGEPVVALVHEPDYADKLCRYPVDLQLSGHSHGGQIRLPILGAPYLPEGATKYPFGLYKIGPMTLYTNAGIGTIRIPVRLNCPPEITLFTLRTAGRSGRE